MTWLAAALVLLGCVTTARPVARADAPTSVEVPPGDEVLLHVQRRGLVLVVGLPGAGKTSLVRRLAPAPGVMALDAEDVAGALARIPLPYRALRPLVHLLHLLRLLLVLVTGVPCVLSSDPLTSRRRRRCFAAAAALSGRRLHVVLVHAEPHEARDGQRRRGRVLHESRMAEHERRYAQGVASGRLLEVDHVLTRPQAARAVLVVGGRPRRPSPASSRS